MVTRSTSAKASVSGGRPAPTRPVWVRLPRYAYAGAVLNIAAWTSSWAQIGPWPYTFFALWLGFILVLDGVNLARAGTSPLVRSRGRFVAMFVISCPFWWTFELLNARVQNWHYVFDHPYSTLAYFLIASLNFSTVLPAVMEMAELLATFPRLRPRLAPPDVGPRATNRTAAWLLGVGVLMVVLPFQ